MTITQSLLSWRSFNDKNIQSSVRFRAKAFLLLAAILTLLLSTASSSFAGSATWLASPTSKDWNTATNWMPATVPNGSADTATFDFSNKTGISLSANTEVNGIVFNAGASAFTITASPTFTLTISGVGITNNSGITQNFSGAFGFTNSATAGSQTNFTIISGAGFSGTSSAGNGTFTVNGGAVSGFYSGSRMQFIDTSTAGNGTFTNNGGAVSGAGGGYMLFFGTSTAGSGTFTNNGGAVSGAYGGHMEFRSGAGATAANAIITNNGSAFSGGGGGFTYFTNTSTAGNSTLIANGGSGGGQGGSIIFAANSHGGTARVEVFGNGTLSIGNHENTGVTTGSIEGDGVVDWVPGSSPWAPTT